MRALCVRMSARGCVRLKHRRALLCSVLAPQGGGWNVYCFLWFLPRRINFQHSVNLVPRTPAHWRDGVHISRISACRILFHTTGRLRRASRCSISKFRGVRLRPYRHRIGQHGNRRNPRNAQNRIQQRTILRTQSRHVRLQRLRVTRGRNSPPNCPNVHGYFAYVSRPGASGIALSCHRSPVRIC